MKDQVLSPLALGSVPEPILRTLQALTRRVRRMILLRGLCAVAAVAIASLLAIMAVDATVVLFSAAARWGLTLTAFGLTILATVWFLLRPLARTLTPTGMARALEARHPEMQERISSAVELLTSLDAPELRGSEALIAALVEESTQTARAIQPQREVTARSARPYLLAAGITLVLLAASMITWPQKTTRLFARAVAPFLNLPNLSADDLEVSPGDFLIAQGQSFEVQISIRSRAVRAAFFRRSGPDGSETPEAMTLLPPGADGEMRFRHAVAAGQQTFRYRIHAGDALSQRFTVTVVAPPAIQRFDIRYDYPVYTNKGWNIDRDCPGDIRAVAGTTVTVTATINKPVPDALFHLNGLPRADIAVEQAEPESAPAAAEKPAPARAFRLKLDPSLAGSWTLKLTDEHGFSNQLTERRIEIDADAPPIIRITQPQEKKLLLNPHDRIPICYSAQDDFGVRRIEMLLEADGQKRGPIGLHPARPADPSIPEITAETVLSLYGQKLERARHITVQLRAADALPEACGGPQVAFSEILTIEVEAKATDYAAIQILAEKQKIKEELQKVQQRLADARKDTQPLKDSLPQSAALTEKQEKQIEEVRKNLSTAEDTTRNLAEKLEDSDFQRLTEKLHDLADQHLDKAENLASQISLADEPQARAELATQADQKIDQAATAVAAILQDLDALADELRQAAEIEKLAGEQTEIAEQRLAEQSSTAPTAQSDVAQPQPPQPQPQPTEAQPAAAEQAVNTSRTPKELQQRQAELAGNLADRVADSPEALQAALRQEQAQAKQLSTEAKELATEQAILSEETERVKEILQKEKVLQALAAEQARLAQSAAEHPLAAEHAPTMSEAARDLQSGEIHGALDHQAAAESALQRAAKQARSAQESEPGQQKQAAEQSPHAPPPPSEASRSGAEQPSLMPQQDAQPLASPEDANVLAQLAEEQADLRQRTAQLGAERDQLFAAHQEAEKWRLQSEQAEVVREARDLAQSLTRAQSESAPEARQAARSASEAAKQLNDNHLSEAAHDAQQAGQDLARLADHLAREAAQPFARPEAGQQEGQSPAQDSGPQESAQQAGQPQAGQQPQEEGQQAKGHQAGQPQGGQQPQGSQQSQEGGQDQQGQQAGQQEGQQEGQSPAQDSGPQESAQQAGQPQAGQQPQEEGQQAKGHQAGQPQGGRPEGGHAGSSPGQDSRQPTNLPQAAQDASTLAERQQQIAEELQALASGQPQSLLAEQQQHLSERIGEIAESAGLLGQQAQQLLQNPAPAQETSRQAGSQLGQAQQSAQQAASQLGQPTGQQAEGQQQASQQGGQQSQGQQPASAQGQPAAVSSFEVSSAVQPSQQSTAQSLNAAAQSLEGLSQSLAPAQSPSRSPESQSLAEAFGAASEAAQSQQALDAAQAAQALSQAAAQSSAQARGKSPSSQPGRQLQPAANAQPSAPLNSSFGSGEQAMDLSLGKLEELGINLSDWSRLPGELRSQILQAAARSGPEEYRGLIKRYFQEIAKRGGAAPEGTEP